MHNQVKYYVDYLFRTAADTPKNEAMKQEILRNAMDRYNDLTAKGMAPEDAFRQVRASIGDISHLIDPAPVQPKAPEQPVVQQAQKKSRTGLWITLGCIAALIVLLISLCSSLLQLTAKPSHYRNEDSVLEQVEDALEDAAARTEEQLETGVDDALQWMENASDAIATGSITIQYDNARSYTAGSAQVPADGIQEISVEWPIGRVQVGYHDGTDILATETEGNLVMQWRQEGRELDIRFCEPGRNLSAQSKTLKLLLPRSLQAALEIDTVSAETEIRDVSLRSLDCETTSGHFLLYGIVLENDLHFESVSGDLTAELSCLGLETETVSGNLQVTGTLRRTDLETTSGSFSLILSETPDLVEFESTSGSLDMTIPGERSFTAAMETVSGKLSSQLALSGPDRLRTYTGENTNPAAFTFETISGDVKIRK